MKGAGQITEVQFRDGAVSSGTDFPSWHYMPLMLFGKQAIKEWGKPPQTKNISQELLQVFGLSFSDLYNESS